VTLIIISSVPYWSNWHWYLKESESGHIVNAHKFINYELEFDLNNPYIPTEKEIIGTLDKGGGN
jgi:hypothetical protein